MSKAWSTLDSLRQEARRRWERGAFWKYAFDSREPLQYQAPIQGPLTVEWSSRFAEVREWVQQLQQEADAAGLELLWKESTPRSGNMGKNRVPTHLRIEGMDNLAAFVGQTDDLALLRANYATLRERFPMLEAWALQAPQKMRVSPPVWTKCLDVFGWMLSHPAPGIYLREIPLPGIDSKFVESQQGLLKEWLAALGIPGREGERSFAARYGFREKPKIWRIRILDRDHFIQGFSDLTLAHDELAKWRPGIKNWIIIENDITALSMPPLPHTAVIFGRGYGFDGLQEFSWLFDSQVYYWGDLDTHGLAILSQFRALFPHTRSLLMDEPTLLEHQDQWAQEPSPCHAVLEHLDPDEQHLYNELTNGTYGHSIRLEQERISWPWAMRRIAELGLGS